MKIVREQFTTLHSVSREGWLPIAEWERAGVGYPAGEVFVSQSTIHSTGLPEFTTPPVIEVALSVQYEPVELAPPTLLDLCTYMRTQGFVGMEIQPLLPPAFEGYMGGLVQDQPIVVQMALPIGRLWFTTSDGDRLIQVQADRFVHNWRKRPGQLDYPRYSALRALFQSRFIEFQSFVKTHAQVPLSPNQVEVTYVNHIDVGPSGSSPLMAEVLAIAACQQHGEFLPCPEATRIRNSYIMSDSRITFGRLHVAANYVPVAPNQPPAIALHLTARGAPAKPDVESVMDFLDAGHEWVVRGFADVTTLDMHRLWGRTR